MDNVNLEKRSNLELATVHQPFERANPALSDVAPTSTPTDEQTEEQLEKPSPDKNKVTISKVRLSFLVLGLCLNMFLVVLDFVQFPSGSAHPAEYLDDCNPQNYRRIP
jgi:hypothetical protein